MYKNWKGNLPVGIGIGDVLTCTLSFLFFALSCSASSILTIKIKMTDFYRNRKIKNTYVKFEAAIEQNFGGENA